jgi:TonB family protein
MRVFQSVMLLCMLPLCTGTTYGVEITKEETRAFAAAAAPGALTPEQVAAIGAWKQQIARQLESKKQYPAVALPRLEQGTVLILFRLDRQGRLVSSRISRGSGSVTLDNAGLALVRQAQPFPSPPPPLVLPQISVPIRYAVRPAPLPRCTLANRLVGPCTSP